MGQEKIGKGNRRWGEENGEKRENNIHSWESHHRLYTRKEGRENENQKKEKEVKMTFHWKERKKK